MNATAHRLVDDYLQSLDAAARSLPRRDRDELMDQIRAHLDESVVEDSTEAEVRNILDALGDPRDIVAAAGPVRAPVRRGAREVFALLFLFTGIPPVIGWFAGLGLLIWSPLWTTRQKLLGALVWPGGFLSLAVVLGTFTASSSVTLCHSAMSRTAVEVCNSSGSGTNPLWWVFLAAAVIAPIAVAIYLWHAAGRRSAD